MPQTRRSPITRFALPQFHDSFDDLLSVQAFITPFSRLLLETIFERIMWFGRTKHDYNVFERTARVAYHFLESGSKANHKAVAKQFYAVINKVVPALNDSCRAQIEANQIPKDNADNRIEKYLMYYKAMHEGLLPFICAPVVYAFGIAENIRNKAFTPGINGKIDLHTISKMNKWLIYSENRLTIGLNSHVRNAYAHNNYRILDDAKVELWDRDWGPEIWQLDQLIQLCDQLWVNALGITCALVLYDINNNWIVGARGWMSPTKAPHLRRQELKSAIEAIADELGFYLEKVEALSNGVSITLSTKPKGIDQEGKLYMGYKSHTDFFKIPVRYEEKRVIDQLVIMLHHLIPYFETQNEVSINVVSWDDVSLGSLITDFCTFIGLQLEDTKPETVDAIRQVFKTDTLGDCVTFVEKEGAPKFVGRGPARPDNS
jgi:hypothetical protein